MLTPENRGCRGCYGGFKRSLADTRIRQNNSALEELSSKVSALRGVTINIYDNARSQEVIDNSVSSHTFV